ncbi:quinone oxidoreductase family protein [Geodermatophilus maliterrae]|uniref:Quinone oxidoreductase n=1 Tax=Geodermatophilus maliterrae TaxID=3162531 RepID=A0ABV3XHI6_9ACTN
MLESQGPPSVLRAVDCELPEPGQGQVLVRVVATGVNVVDLLQRSGSYAVSLPFTPGLEGSGVVERVGPGTGGVSPGDRVAWAAPAGSYATHCLVRADRIVPVPERLPLEVAATVLVQGMTAHALATDVVPLRPGDVCLVHAAAGGVGGLLCQYAAARGATVVATASGAEKAQTALAHGARYVVDYAVDYTVEDVAARVRELTGGVDVVYDGVGRDTFAAGLSCLRPRGTFVLYGQTSGPVPPVDPQVLQAGGSLFLTKASLGAYDPTREDLLRRAATVFDDVLARRLVPRLHAAYALEEAAEAHAEIESRRSIGKLLLRP